MKYAETAKAIKGLEAIPIPVTQAKELPPPSPSARKCQFQEQVNYMTDILERLEATVRELETLLAGVLRPIPTEGVDNEPSTEPSLVPVAEVIATFVGRLRRVTQRIESIGNRVEV
jgi:hypothetical protein